MKLLSKLRGPLGEYNLKKNSNTISQVVEIFIAQTFMRLLICYNMTGKITKALALIFTTAQIKMQYEANEVIFSVIE